MTPEDYAAAARVVRKYVAAVETKLCWDMSTREAKIEVAEAERLAALLDAEEKRHTK